MLMTGVFGGWSFSTVSRAALLKTVPEALAARARKRASLSPSCGLRLRVRDVAPATSAQVWPLSSLRCHWNVGAGVPEASTVNVAAWPRPTVRSCGCWVMAGARLAV